MNIYQAINTLTIVLAVLHWQSINPQNEQARIDYKYTKQSVYISMENEYAGIVKNTKSGAEML